ncbi:MAG: CoA transferase, partial [Actinobacteria bacterium]
MTKARHAAGGPLTGISVLEMAGIGPVPFCASLLADLGADVIRLDRVRGAAGALPDPLLAADRGRRSVAVDVKLPQGREVALRLASGVDVLLEGYRPGVMERLGLGPEECSAGNPGLVYGRMTGWGQGGPYAGMAGHDINYIGLSGALHAIGTPEDPLPPLNLVGDYGGGALYLALGVLAALVDRQRTGLGQVVDAAMVDGAASLMSVFYRLHAVGFWEDRRGANLLDGAAPFYRTYRTRDGGHVAVGALEPEFYS